MKYIVTFILIFFAWHSKANHLIGGELTWSCDAGKYVFEYTYYRDCNGPDINNLGINISVWGHPTVTSISLPFVSREDISPICTQVVGGPAQMTCGLGASGGSGLGALEKIIYRSNPTALAGTPPASGWVFTYDECCRDINVTNLANATNVGTTIKAIIYTNDAMFGCIDNSPKFLQSPYFVSCAGEPFEYNMNVVDPDLDSLYIHFEPLVSHLNGGNYNPPSNPPLIPYATGFSATSPTPSPAMNVGNVSAILNSSNGNLTFTSQNTGQFAMKVVAESYRGNVKVAQVEREMTIFITNCTGSNSKPTITGPFAGSFETTVLAGDIVNFNLAASDIELLQDGSPQSNILTASGLNFSPDFIDNSNCLIAPCPTLNSTPPITMSQGVNVDFNWQTDCDHLVHPITGEFLKERPYHYVFKVQDDYCPTPKVSYATITINVTSETPSTAPELNCIQASGGDLILNWTPSSDPAGTFNGYEIYSTQNGLIGTNASIAANSFTVIGGATALDSFYVVSTSSCNGLYKVSSDTLSNIFLDVTNPSNGTAVLDWTGPTEIPSPDYNSYYYIYREYPVGTWSLYDSVLFSQTNYIDTIDICQTDLNYQIVLENTACDFNSNIDGDNFTDMITPDVPSIKVVSIDTLTGMVSIEWDENSQEDTYGYIVYQVNSSGVPVELDTVWGLTNTTYTYFTSTSSEALSYSIAAFDSCFTTSFPPTYQTSAKGEIHSSVFVSGTVNVCSENSMLTWTAYEGWSSVDHYNIYSSINGGSWVLEGTTTNLIYTYSMAPMDNYRFVIEAVNNDGRSSFSNIIDQVLNLPQGPTFNYLTTATVNDSLIIIRYFVDNSKVSKIDLLRSEDYINFEVIETKSVGSTNITFIDENVLVNETSYTYKIQVYDSCGRPSSYSNNGKTMLLKSISDNVSKRVYLYWNNYRQFDGPLLSYKVYRGTNGDYPNELIATLNDGDVSYEDTVANIFSDGEYCYRVVAVEGTNSYGFADSSNSNITCQVFKPLIYIPNSFTPDGDAINSIFIPVLNDFDPELYVFSIYSHWGKLIYTTNDPSEGWDGTIPSSGNIAQSGTYLYVLSLRDGNGNEVLKRGHVNLLK